MSLGLKDTCTRRFESRSMCSASLPLLEIPFATSHAVRHTTKTKRETSCVYTAVVGEQITFFVQHVSTHCFLCGCGLGCVLLYEAVGDVELGSLVRRECRGGGVEGWRGETGGDSAGVEIVMRECNNAGVEVAESA